MLRCNLLPEAWKASRATRERRQQVRLRISLGQHRAALKNQVHAVLHQHGKRSPVSDTFGRRGRDWLRKIALPPVARQAVDTYSSLIDQVGQHIERQEQRLQGMAHRDARAKWLATIPGVGTYSAIFQPQGAVQLCRTGALGARIGGAPHVARVALARKLVAAVFAMLRDGQCFHETIFATV